MNKLVDIFTYIYDNNRWKNSETRSGRGSTIFHTENIRIWLPKLIADRNITSILDVGCGDWNWMKTTNLNIPYTGCDIVPTIIEYNQRHYARENPAIRFFVANAVEDPLPVADLVICRDVLYHLCYENINILIKKLARVSMRYLLITNCPWKSLNVDVKDGGYRPLNFLKNPFNLPEPIEIFKDCEAAGEIMILYDRTGLEKMI
jgi:SAM-dependent methyltransferase